MTPIKTDILCIEILNSIKETDARISEVEIFLSEYVLLSNVRRRLGKKLSRLKCTKKMLEESFEKAVDRDPKSVFGKQGAS